MSRSLSLYRRRANLIDLTIPVRDGVKSYEFYSATNFDGTYTKFDTIPASGKASKSMSDLAIDGSSKFRGFTRFLFNPDDYTLDDKKPIWVSIKQITTGGTTGSAEAGQLILPYSSTPNRPVILSGTAPHGATITSSLEIQLPHQCQSASIKCNDAGVSLYVAFEPGGTEYKVLSSVDALGYEFRIVYESITQLFVRGDTAVAGFDAVFSMRNNPHD